jgi:hypothetical protein
VKTSRVCKKMYGPVLVDSRMCEVDVYPQYVPTSIMKITSEVSLALRV